MIHPLADCQNSNVPESSNVWQFCVVLPGAKIGERVNICSHCFIENDVKIGNDVTVKCGVQLWDGVELEDGVDGLVHISQISDQRVDKVKDALQVGQEVEARVVKVDRGERRIGLSIRAVNMSEDELKALEAEAADSTELTSAGSAQGAELGSLGAAFDALGSVEWQPGEDK